MIGNSPANCREDEDEVIAAKQRTSPAPAAAAPEWLQVADPRQPAAYLAQVTGQTAPELSPGLTVLARHYRESDRMIANRLAQLWATAPPDLPALPRLMQDLIPPDDGQHRSLGPVIQQYRVLRDQGTSHDEAIARATGRAP